ncbi:hypothetical protein IT087_03545 [Candidatus Uhrbacteria bacterium]|nr:hypothetical protein [Candidatus Uhrbacteria bacterium]
MNPLPSDFRDRPHRWFWNLLVFLRIRQVKAVCCESFRKPLKGRDPSTSLGMTGVACKGCATLYDKESSSWFYRSLARIAKRRVQ